MLSPKYLRGNPSEVTQGAVYVRMTLALGRKVQLAHRCSN